MKRKIICKSALFILCFMAVLWVATMESTTKQAIDYKEREFKIPLYLKTLDFIDRHLNYRWTVQKIINKDMTDHQKVEAIYQWTIRSIARQPKELPIIDDHVWHIIVRGYGLDGQMVDVFATLSNYAGCRAFILSLKGSEGGTIPNSIDLGFVYFDGAWHICDPYRQTEFVNRQGRWATINEILSGNWREKAVNNELGKKDSLDYRKYFPSLNAIDFEGLYENSRSSIQSPVRRFKNFFRS